MRLSVYFVLSWITKLISYHWWIKSFTIINKFLESYDFADKTIIPFVMSGGSGMGKTNEKLQPSCPSAKLLDNEVLASNITIAELNTGLIV